MTVMEPARAALVVAADEFADPKFQRLRSPAKDADALAQVLADAEIGGFQVQTVVNQPNAVVAQELERFFSGRKPDDLLLLYFSCHGVKDPSGRLYFVTSNTTFNLLRSTGVSASFVSEQMEYSRSKRIVVLLDCCYSGAFLKGFRARGDDAVAVDQLEGRGRAVITASRATEYAFEADELTTENARPSMFTGAIVEGLASGRADANGDGLVTVDELYDYVYDAVRGKVAGQTPGRWTDVEGDLVVARNPAPPVTAAALPAELLRAVDSDFALQRLGAVSELVQWYRAGDPARQLAAGTVLEQLSRDYDERVKAAALAALAPTADAQGPPALGPVPVTAPAPPDEQPARVRVAGPPPPPADAVVADGMARTAGWLALIGGFAVLLGPYFDYRRFPDYAEKLSDKDLFSIGTFVIFGLAAYAAHCLLRSTKSLGTGLAVLVGLLPLAVSGCLGGIGDLVQQKDHPRPGAGWLLMEGGLALFAAAGTLAAIRWRRKVSVSPRLWDVVSLRETGVTAIALVIGAAASFGGAKLASISGDGFIDLAPPVPSLVLRLLVLSALAGGAWRWAQARPALRPALVGGTVVLYAVAAALFLSHDLIWDQGEWLFLAGFTAFAIGAAIVPALSTVVVPVRHGFVLLAAWATAHAAWLPSALAEGYDGNLLGAALAAAAVLAAFLAMSTPELRRPRTPAKAENRA